MTDLRRLQEGHAPIAPHRRIDCPTYHSPLYQFTPQGIACRCKSCRGGIHIESWESVDQYRASLGPAMSAKKAEGAEEG